MQKKNKSSRRDFLKTSSSVAAGAALVGGLSIGRSAHAQGSDLINVALIGCGGRGQGAVRDRLKVGDNMKVIAVADAFEQSAKNAANALKKDADNPDNGWKEKVDIADDRVFSGLNAFKQAIDCLNPGDEILIATAPGFRPQHYAYAVEKGLNVFMEKPCCTDAAGFKVLMDANKKADEKNLKVCVGLQRRYDKGFQDWIKKVHDGEIGDLLFSRVYWNGGGIWCRKRDPGESEMHYQIKNWYHFVWLCGDNITEQHVHNLDVGLWLHSKGDQMCHPVECNAMGGRQNPVCSEELRRQAPPFADRAAWDEWYQKNKGEFNRHGQAWDHFACEYTFADGSKMFSQCRHIGNCFNSVSNYAHGTKGHGYAEGGAWLKDHAGQEIYKGPASSGAFQYEHVVHTQAIRENKKMNYGWNGALSSMTAVLGREAAFSGKIVKWDELVEKGKTYIPTEGYDNFDQNPPVMPDADGFYENSVAKEGVYNPFA